MLPSFWVNEEIKLETMSPKYREDIFTEFNEDIIRYLLVEQTPEKIEETDAFISRAMSQMKDGVDLVWVIIANDEFCGCCGIHNIPSRTPHFGIWIKTNKQGQGIGFQVTKAVMEWAIKTLDVDYVKYPVDQDNIPSVRLIQKLTPTVYDRYLLRKGKELLVNEYRLYPSKNKS